MKVRTLLIAILVLFVSIAAIRILYTFENRTRTAETVRVSTTPSFSYRYDSMIPGVLQHVDREYTYDYIPAELENGLLFQGIHRPAKGTSIEIELFQAATVYFFFQNTWDGGYSEIFPILTDWEKCTDAPQYDIQNGDHGLHMTMYKIKANRGSYQIPATTRENACFNIVFQFN